MTANTHCERCGHNLSDHDTRGVCMHRVEYGAPAGICPCDNYLRGVGTLAEELGRALFASPGRDANGAFYSMTQAMRVGRLCEALLDSLTPSTSISATELCDAWVDAAAPGHRRRYTLENTDNTAFFCYLHDYSEHEAKTFSWSSTQNIRDAAAKAIMKAGQEGFGS
jgi:hypothetical protein